MSRAGQSKLGQCSKWQCSQGKGKGRAKKGRAGKDLLGRANKNLFCLCRAVKGRKEQGREGQVIYFHCRHYTVGLGRVGQG